MKPYFEIAGEQPRPQFSLKARNGREYGVVEYYETERTRPHTHLLLEFFTAEASSSARARATSTTERR